MREKLIEILRVPIYPHELADPTEVVADYLLDNDVVPVVLCRDCKYFDEGWCEYINNYHAWGYTRKETDFCSDGERKDNG